MFRADYMSRAREGGGFLRLGDEIRTRGRRWRATRGRILSAEPLCRHCRARGHVTLATEVDHIKPLSQGGTDDESNLQPLCKQCHADKTAADEGWTRAPAIGADGWPTR